MIMFLFALWISDASYFHAPFGRLYAATSTEFGTMFIYQLYIISHDLGNVLEFSSGREVEISLQMETNQALSADDIDLDGRDNFFLFNIQQMLTAGFIQVSDLITTIQDCADTPLTTSSEELLLWIVAIRSIAGSRLILNLRRMTCKSPTDARRKFTSIFFAQAVTCHDNTSTTESFFQ
ncbi:hypothetical protein BDQ17DRAFT_1331948 [Cyathus striatus]|nr:hypothetical protein BDQ17DRAFT_1331948 [Cyathus striatus]